MTDKESGESSTGEEEEKPQVVPSLDNSVIPPPSTPQPVRLDPLVQSLTRNNADTSDAKTVQVPLLGELMLDRSLFIFVPAVAFGVIGFVASIYVALTATDEWVIPSQPEQASKVVNDSGCRGLCSQQDQDLERMRNYMQGFSK